MASRTRSMATRKHTAAQDTRTAEETGRDHGKAISNAASSVVETAVDAAKGTAGFISDVASSAGDYLSGLWKGVTK